MGKTVDISPLSSVYTRKSAAFQTLFSEKPSKFKGFTWNAVFLALLGLSTPACGVTGAMLRISCKHQDLKVEHCLYYPKLTRAKRDPREFHP